MRDAVHPRSWRAAGDELEASPCEVACFFGTSDGNARTESMNPPRPACERRRAHDDWGYDERGVK